MTQPFCFTVTVDYIHNARKVSKVVNALNKTCPHYCSYSTLIERYLQLFRWR